MPYTSWINKYSDLKKNTNFCYIKLLDVYEILLLCYSKKNAFHRPEKLEKSERKVGF